jgi:undecaprenyl-diphosphatase
MNPFEAVILGIVQGLTEFLPISSSAHVQIVQQLIGQSNMTKPALTAFIATIQLGTELAVLLYFWKDIVRIAKAFFASIFRGTKSSDSKLGWLIILGSVPVVVIGLAFKDLIENQLRNLWVVSLTLIVFGIILALADRFGKQNREIETLTTKHGLLFGLGQALAVIPGVSRSGGTISVGLALGYSRRAAARYSFLLAIPAVMASGLYQFAKTYQDLESADLAATALGTLVSFLVGYAVIVALLRYLNRGSFMPFVIWRIVLGLAVLIGLLTGVLVA